MWNGGGEVVQNVKGGGDGEVQCLIGDVLQWWALLAAVDDCKCNNATKQ